MVSEQTFFQKRNADGQQVYEKVLNITNHQAKPNQNHNELSPHAYQDVIFFKDNYWRGCGEKGILVPSLQACKLVQPLWKTVYTYNGILNNFKIIFKNIKREENPAICDNIDGPGEHYAE